MGQLFKFLTKDMDLIKEMRLVHVKRGVKEVCVFTQDFNSYLLDNGNSSYYLCCYAYLNRIDPGMCSHFYHGNTDPRDSTWLLCCEAIWDDPNPEKTKVDE